MVKYLKKKNTSVSDLEGGANIESDCEESSWGIKGGTQGAKEVGGEEIRAVLITGSFSAYVLAYFVPFSGEMTGSSAGNLSSFTAAQTQSPSLLSDHREAALDA